MARTFTINKGADSQKEIEAWQYTQDGEYFTFFTPGGDQVFTVRAARVSTIERTSEN